MSRLRLLFALPLYLLAGGLGGCAATFPSFDDAPPGADAPTALLEASIAAHGGYLWDDLAAIRVSYTGNWGRAIRFIQPEIVDYDYRKSSVEELDLENDVLVQRHTGPEGEKLVRRGTDSIDVEYDGEASTDEDTLLAAALVADAYALFLTGPSWIKRRGAELRAIEPAEEDGRTYERLIARVEPGIGQSPGDDVVLWIDGETKELFRIHFTLEGFPGTRGAHVDVTYSEPRDFDGYRFPTHFVERVRGPIRAFAHEWDLLELELTPRD